MTDRPTVAVIGAGFSGVLTALRLLLPPDGPRVLLLERGPRFARGAAYATGSPHHLLNVRATNMSAFVEQPSHFLQWLGAAGVDAPEQVFVTRDHYGRYLQSILREATSGAAADRLVLEHDEVLSLTREGEGWGLQLGVGKVLRADAVVLAIGNLTPPNPPETDPALLTSPRYVADPWGWSGADWPPPGDILLLGTGLTAVDIALTIEAAQPGTRIVALSRHGLLPRPHGELGEAAAPADAPSGSPAEVLAEVRRRAAADWRGTLDGLRPHVQSLWRGWSVRDRGRFLRHLRPWWDVHRHRLAPQVAARLDALREAGIFLSVAARLQRLHLERDGVTATWKARGETDLTSRRFALVINCTGPQGDVAQSADPLIGSLLASGLIRADACRLGIDVDARSRAIGAVGEPTPTLFAVGPITRGHVYEITSVPDIRIQAAQCADDVLGALALRARATEHALRLAGPEGIAAELSAFLNQSMAEVDVELASLKFAGRVRNAWELRGRRAAMGEIALWLDDRRRKTRSSDV